MTKVIDYLTAKAYAQEVLNAELLGLISPTEAAAVFVFLEPFLKGAIGSA